MAGRPEWSRSASAAGTSPATTAKAVSSTVGRRTKAPYWARSQTGSPLAAPVPAIQRPESDQGCGDASLNRGRLVERLGGRSTGHVRRNLHAHHLRPPSPPGAFSMNRALVASVALASLAAGRSNVRYDHIRMSATHDHNSPYYSTPAAGVWLFQDVMDLRMFEYQARAMAQAIETAEKQMVPARMGGTVVQAPEFQGNIAGADRNEDGSPTGYPLWENDHGVTVLRFDDMTNPASPKPLATYVNYAEHGESLDGYDLISADWLAPFQRYVDRATGATMVFSQGSVGSAEGPYDYANPKMADDNGDAFPEVYGHEGYAQAERGTHLLAEKVVAAWNAIGGADSAASGGIAVSAPMQTDPTVTMLTHWV